jgi:hypothetical protein
MRTPQMLSLICVLSSLTSTSYAIDFGAIVNEQLKSTQQAVEKTAVKTEPKNAEESSQNSDFSNDEIALGLKEALSVGTQAAVKLLGQDGGYLDNDLVKIKLPESLQLVSTGLRKVGQGKRIDEFVVTMNRAAEKSVVEAAAVFSEVLDELSMDDAQTLLDGADNAATEYFKAESLESLKVRMLPLIKKVTADTGVTSAYKTLTAQTGGIDLGALSGGLSGLLGGKTDAASSEPFDLDEYITIESLEGLFVMLAEQEKQIRSNPAAQASSLLQKLFAK